jgi:hypothetical protein
MNSHPDSCDPQSCCEFCNKSDCWYLAAIRKQERNDIFKLLENAKTEAEGIECVTWNDIEYYLGE